MPEIEKNIRFVPAEKLLIHVQSALTRVLVFFYASLCRNAGMDTDKSRNILPPIIISYFINGCRDIGCEKPSANLLIFATSEATVSPSSICVRICVFHGRELIRGFVAMVLKLFIIFLLALQSEFMSKCTCFNMIVDKRYQQVPSKQTFSVLCQADVPLTACQMKRYSLGVSIIFDLGKGNVSTPVTDVVSYAGTGLATGQCGMTISKPSLAGAYSVYGCRARSGAGGWKHSAAVIDVSDGTYWTLPVESGPGTVIADAGSNVTLSFATGGPLNFCNFKWPGLTNWTRSGVSSTYSIDDADLDEGKCRLTLFNVTADSSGFLLTDVRSKYRIKGKRGDFMHLTTLIVKAAPAPPVLTFTTRDGFVNEVDNLEASCLVGPARPAARITWLLGDDVIRNDLADDTDSGGAWLWEYEAQTVTQNLHRKVTTADDGKELVCRAEHVALPGGMAEARMTITVKESRLFYLPRRTAWFLIGVGTCLVCVVVVLTAAWIIHSCITRSWRFANREMDKVRSSPIYEVVNLPSGSDRVQTANVYIEMNGRTSVPSSCQESHDKCRGNN